MIFLIRLIFPPRSHEFTLTNLKPAMTYNVSITARMNSPIASRARFAVLFYFDFSICSAPYSNEYNLFGAALSASYLETTPQEAPLRVEAPNILYTTPVPSAAPAVPAAAGAADDAGSAFAFAPAAAQAQPPAGAPRYSRAAQLQPQSSHIVGDTQSQLQPPSNAAVDNGVRYAEGLQLRRASGIRGRILLYYVVVVTASQAAGTTPDSFLASKVRTLHSARLCASHRSRITTLAVAIMKTLKEFASVFELILKFKI